LPSQLAYHFWPDWAFILGIRVDYLAPTVYLTDILVMTLLILWLPRQKNLPRYFLIILIFAFVNIGFSILKWASLFKWLKIFELFLFAFYVSQNKNLIQKKIFLKVLSLSLFLVSIIGILQFLLGRTIGGPLYFLGERSFEINTPGISRQNIFGRDFLRPYSTFSHPNSLAGFISLTFLAFSGSLRLIPSIALFLTNSLSAFIGLITVLFFQKLGRLILITFFISSFILPAINLYGDESVTERLKMSRLATQIIRKNFWVGTGLNTFVYQNPYRQPVHNIFLLIFSETGVIGFLVFTLFLFRGISRSAPVFIFVLVTSFFDHYWLTLQQNMLLLSLVYGYFF